MTEEKKLTTEQRLLLREERKAVEKEKRRLLEEKREKRLQEQINKANRQLARQELLAELKAEREGENPKKSMPFDTHRKLANINQEQFESLCNILCTREEILSILKVDDKTLTDFCVRTYKQPFSAAYKHLSANGKMSLRRTQFKLAEANATLSIWLGKQYLDQVDVTSDTIYRNERAKARAKLEILKESCEEDSASALAMYIKEQIKDLKE